MLFVFIEEVLFFSPPQGDCNIIEICILEMLVGLWKREIREQLVFRSLLLQINLQFLLPELKLHKVREAVIFCCLYPASPLSALRFIFSF